MGERASDFGDDVDFALITFSDPKYLRAYQKRTAWEHPILTDSDLSVYHQFGYERGSAWRVYGWKALRRYYDILRRDGLGALSESTEDTLQLGGDAVIAADGSASWVFRGAGPDERPSVETLLSEVDKARHHRG